MAMLTFLLASLVALLAFPLVWPLELLGMLVLDYLLVCQMNLDVPKAQCYCCHWLIGFCICRLGVSLLRGVIDFFTDFVLLFAVHNCFSNFIQWSIISILRSSRTPVIDSSKLLPPQATFRGMTAAKGLRKFLYIVVVKNDVVQFLCNCICEFAV